MMTNENLHLSREKDCRCNKTAKYIESRRGPEKPKKKFSIKTHEEERDSG